MAAHCTRLCVVETRWTLVGCQSHCVAFRSLESVDTNQGQSPLPSSVSIPLVCQQNQTTPAPSAGRAPVGMTVHTCSPAYVGLCYARMGLGCASDGVKGKKEKKEKKNQKRGPYALACIRRAHAHIRILARMAVGSLPPWWVGRWRLLCVCGFYTLKVFSNRRCASSILRRLLDDSEAVLVFYHPGWVCPRAS
jgi:hypothetical protein